MARRGYRTERLGELLEDGGAKIVTIDGLGVCTSVSGVLVRLGDADGPADVRSIHGAEERATARAHGLEVPETAADPEVAREPEPPAELLEVAPQSALDTTDAIALLDSINKMIGEGMTPGSIAGQLLNAGFAVRDEGDAGYVVTAFGRVLSYNVGDGRNGPGFATLYSAGSLEPELAATVSAEPAAPVPGEDVFTEPAGGGSGAESEIDASDAFTLLDSLEGLVRSGCSSADVVAVLERAGYQVRDDVDSDYHFTAFGQDFSFNIGDGPEETFATMVWDESLARVMAESASRERSEPLAVVPIGLATERATNYRITDEDVRWIASSSPKLKFAANMVAMRTLRTLEEENRPATADEQTSLARFTGWGGFPQLFDRYNAEWYDERREFEKVVDRWSDEYARAKESTQNSHFTSAPIVDAIYGGLARLGFEGGRMLEPSLGSGNFLGRMPESLRTNPTTRVTGVEMDPTTAAVARHLYPQYPHILNEKFEKARILDGFYDVVIGNVPFGDYQIYDPALRAKYPSSGRGLRVHNFFIARSLEKLRDDGLLALITSTGTLDARDAEPFRKSLAREAELVGAARLPEGTFRATAGTDVTVDVLFLRKRNAAERARIEAGETPSGPGFARTVASSVLTYYGDPIYINEYFHNHPHMILGELAAGGEFGNRSVVKGTGEDPGRALERALANLPVGIFREIRRPERERGRDLSSWVETAGLKEFGYTVVTTGGDKQLLVRRGDALVPVVADRDRIDRVEGLIGIREAVREVLDTQIEGLPLDEQVAARDKLNRVYDSFVTRFAPVSDPRNRLAVKGDPDSYLLLALENYDATTRKATKAQIFSEAVVGRPDAVEKVLTAREAVARSIVELGEVDVPTVARLVDTSEIEAAALMIAEGVAFRDPVSGAFVAAEDYLSGNVRAKLETARMVAELDPNVRANVEALEAVQPEPIPARSIGIRLGAGWIPPDVISSFLKDTLKVTITASYIEETAEWVFNSRGRSNLQSVANTREWGTSAFTGASLVEMALNTKVPTVYRAQEGVRVVDIQETEAAREMQSKLRERFTAWVWESDTRLERLETIYNDRFNNFRPRTFATDWYRIPGINPVWAGDTTKGENGLMPHQLAAVSRVSTGANTLLAHCVGAGKSFSGVAGTQECVRLGISKKPMFVVPNQTLVQFRDEYLKLYPAARILAATEGDLEAGNRQEFLSRIATGTWDAVIVAHSTFGMIPMSREYQQRFIDARIAALDEALEDARSDNSDSRVIKKIEAAKKRYESKLEALADMKKDDTVTFEQLGIDRLVVDESHAFKALEFHTKRGSIAGLSTRSSQRAFDLFLKTKYIESIAGQGRGIVFMSGTPITNTLAEMYTIQRFLQNHELEDRGLAHFDAWANQFTETVTGYESTVNNRFELRTRLAEFDNLPELMSLYRGVADVQTAEMLNLPRPELSGGAAIPVISPISDAQTAYVEELSRRVDDIKAKRVKPGEDNMLKVTTNGREASLDIRLARPGTPRDPDGKVAKVAANVARIWRESAPTRATQIVFCDLGTPQTRGRRKGASAAAAAGFNLYEDIRNAIVEQGVARDEIAFVHDYNTDAKRLKLYEAVNDGAIRVVVGSTSKLGVGVNVQKKLLAIHQLDVPYRPCDIEQRLGRILRQGNEHETVFEYRYVTQGRDGKPSFDTYLWQLNETKDRFIRQVMSGEAVPRRLEDIAERSFTYAEFKAIASGNPLLYEKVRVDNDIIRLERLYNAYLSQRRAMRFEVESYIPHTVSHKRRRLERLTADNAAYMVNRPAAGAFTLEILGRTYSDRETAGEAIRAVALGATIQKPGDVVTLGHYAGLEIALVGSMGGAHFCLLGGTIGEDRERYDASFGESAAGTVASLEAVARSLAHRIEVETGEIARLERQSAETSELLVRPFEHEQRLTELRLRQIEIDRDLGLTCDDVQVVMEGGDGADGVTLDAPLTPVAASDTSASDLEPDKEADTAESPAGAGSVDPAAPEPASSMADDAHGAGDARGIDDTVPDGEAGNAAATDLSVFTGDDLAGIEEPRPETTSSVEQGSSGEMDGSTAGTVAAPVPVPVALDATIAAGETAQVSEETVDPVPDETAAEHAARVAAIRAADHALYRGDFVPTEVLREFGMTNLREAWQIPANEYAKGEGFALLDQGALYLGKVSYEMPGVMVPVYPLPGNPDVRPDEGCPVSLTPSGDTVSGSGLHVPATELYLSPADGTLHWLTDPDEWPSIVDPDSGKTFGAIAAAKHERIVADRLAAGGRVPPEILESYQHFIEAVQSPIGAADTGAGHPPPVEPVVATGTTPGPVEAMREEAVIVAPSGDGATDGPSLTAVASAAVETDIKPEAVVSAAGETVAALRQGDYVPTGRVREHGAAQWREVWQIPAGEYARGEGFALLDDRGPSGLTPSFEVPGGLVVIYPASTESRDHGIVEGDPVSLTAPPHSTNWPGFHVPAVEIYRSPADGTLHWVPDSGEWAAIVDPASGLTFGAIAAARHERIVAERVASGERVPPEILESYPDLLEAPARSRDNEVSSPQSIAPSTVETEPVVPTTTVVVATEPVPAPQSSVVTAPAAPDAESGPVAAPQVVAHEVTTEPVAVSSEAAESARPRPARTVATSHTLPVTAGTPAAARVDCVRDDRTGASLWVVGADVRDREKRAAAERFGGSADLTSDPPRFRFRSEAAANAFVSAIGPGSAPVRSHAIPLTGVTAEQFVDAMPDSNLKRMLLGSAARLSEGLDVSRSAALAAAYDLVASQNPHRRIVEGAIEAGRDIPARVRADYVGAGPDELASRVAATRENWRREELVSLPAADMAEWRLSPAEKLARLGDTREARSVAGRARTLRAETGAEWNAVVAEALEEIAEGRLWAATVRKASEEGLDISAEAAAALGIERASRPAVVTSPEQRPAMSLDEFRTTLAAGEEGSADSQVLASRLVSILDGFPAGTRLGVVSKLEANGVSLWAEPGHSFQTTEQFVARDPDGRVAMLYEHAMETLARDGARTDRVAGCEPSVPAVDTSDPDQVQRRVWESAKGFFAEKRDAATSEQERHRLVALGGRVEAWVFAQRDDVLESLDGRGVEALIERALPREATRLLGTEPAATAAATPGQQSLLM